MKIIFRGLIYAFYIIFLWPFLLYKKFGNKEKIRIKNTIIISNHYSNFDSILMKMLLFKNKVRFVATLEVKRNLLTRFFCWSLDCFYVSEEAATNMKFFKEAAAYLKGGGNIVIFPEGVINPRKSGFLPFQEGYLILQKMADSALLPVYLYPAFLTLKRSKIYVGEVVPAETLREMSRGEKNGYIMNQIIEYSLKLNS